VPAGRQFDHQDQRRHGPRSCYFKEDYRTARRQNLGPVQRWARLDFRIHLAHHGRTTSVAIMSKLILAVEDQEDNMQILRDLLTSAGYEIAEAETGALALDTVSIRRADLIVMDIQIPIIDGYEITRRIKADPALRSIPIIAVTSHALTEGEGKARDAGCDDFVAKPYSPRQLLAKIRQYLT